MKKPLILMILLLSTTAYASSAGSYSTNLLLWLALIYAVAIFARASDKIGQPNVLGQLIFGVVISAIASFSIFGLTNITHNDTLSFFAELGSIFLLLEIGLESSLKDISSAGKHAVIVAVIGVLVPFVLGFFIVVPYILNSHNTNLQLFIGSMLAVTSTGISVSVFKELNMLKNQACKIVLAASVIDDILGLVLLSITTGLTLEGTINPSSIGINIINVALFFLISIAFGIYILPTIIRFLSKVNSNSDTIILIIIVFCFSLSYIAGQIGLAFIIGAFLAGLMLSPQLFKQFQQIKGKKHFLENDHQLEYLVAPYGKIFTPIFFIYAGMQVDILNTFNYSTVKIAILISFIAIIGKVVAGIFLPKNINKWLVGFGMVPRGEIGLIFAIAGLQLKIINHELFAALLLMIIITSIITPIVLTALTKREMRRES